MPKPAVYSKKICMLGTFGVGKTSLVRRFVHQVFDDAYLSTIGVQIFQKEIASQEKNVALKLIIWDLANIDTLTPAIKNYFTGASGAIVVCDLTRPATWVSKEILLDTFMSVNPKARIILSGNKKDLLETPSANVHELAEFSSRINTSPILTSAKTGENVEALFADLVQQLLQ